MLPASEETGMLLFSEETGMLLFSEETGDVATTDSVGGRLLELSLLNTGIEAFSEGDNGDAGRGNCAGS